MFVFSWSWWSEGNALVTSLTSPTSTELNYSSLLHHTNLN